MLKTYGTKILNGGNPFCLPDRSIFTKNLLTWKKCNSVTESSCLQIAKHWLRDEKNMQTPSSGFPMTVDVSPQLHWCWGFYVSHAPFPQLWGCWDTQGGIQMHPCPMSGWTSMSPLGCAHASRPGWVPGSSQPLLLRCEADDNLPSETALTAGCTRQWMVLREQLIWLLDDKVLLWG